jgi:hypothetical protein
VIAGVARVSRGVQLDDFAMVANTFGVVGGLFAAAEQRSTHLLMRSANKHTTEKRTKADSEIVGDLAALMAKGETRVDVFYDVSVLPHPKETILQAIEREILREPSDERVEWLTIGALFLPAFQEGIGSKPLPWFGVDLGELERTTPDPGEQSRIVAHNPDSERAQRFLALMKIERDQISARIDAVVRLRNERIAHLAFEGSHRDAEQGDAGGPIKNGQRVHWC